MISLFGSKGRIPMQSVGRDSVIENGNILLIAQVTRFKSEYSCQWPSGGKKIVNSNQKATKDPEFE